jgi:hypothetical protein
MTCVSRHLRQPGETFGLGLPTRVIFMETLQDVRLFKVINLEVGNSSPMLLTAPRCDEDCGADLRSRREVREQKQHRIAWANWTDKGNGAVDPCPANLVSPELEVSKAGAGCGILRNTADSGIGGIARQWVAGCTDT